MGRVSCWKDSILLEVRNILSVRGSIPMTALLADKVYEESLLSVLTHTLSKVNGGGMATTRRTTELIKLALLESPDVFLVDIEFVLTHGRESVSICFSSRPLIS